MKKKIVLTQSERILSLERQVENLRGRVNLDDPYVRGLTELTRQIHERVCGVEMRLARLENPKPWWRFW